MARDGLFVRYLNNVHKAFGTPARSVAMQAMMAVLLVTASAVLVEVDTPFVRNVDVRAVEQFPLVFAASIFTF